MIGFALCVSLFFVWSILVRRLNLRVDVKLKNKLKILKSQAAFPANNGVGYTDYNEPVHEISNNVVCATSKASDQPVHTSSLIRAYASPLSIL